MLKRRTSWTYSTPSITKNCSDETDDDSNEEEYDYYEGFELEEDEVQS